MIANKEGPIRWWFALLGVALLIGLGLAASGVAAQSKPPTLAALASTRSLAAPNTTYLSTDVPKTLPVTGTVTSALTITDVSLITTLDVVSVTISHTFPGDLNVYLVSPLNTRVQLFNNACGGDDWLPSNTGFTLSDGAAQAMGDVCPPGTMSFRPLQPLSALAGQSLLGVWHLEINDTTEEDGGILTAWGLAMPGGSVQPTFTPIPIPTAQPSPTRTVCPISFTDVSPTDYFYQGVQYLFCKGAITGYPDGTFRPYNNTTRSQMTKIVVLGLNVPLFPPPSTPSFSDVPASNTFYNYIEAAKQFGIVSGYTDPAVCPSGAPCFHPYYNVTRGQLVKIVVNAAGWNYITPQTAAFADVPVGSTFFSEVSTAVCYGLINGYPCGGPGEPCDALQRPYFRPNNPAIRGQIAKIAFIADTFPTPCAAVPTPMAHR